MWTLYDRLIEAVPENLTADRIRVGRRWAAVSAGGLCGTAMAIREQEDPPAPLLPEDGTPLREVARLAKSWNFLEAAVGTAAINAYHNRPEAVERLEEKPEPAGPGNGTLPQNAFAFHSETVRGKKTAVIGHFPQIEEFLGAAAVLSILERRPRPGDYPDSACEYLLPEQDFVFITGSTVVNKTLPRLLTLSGGAYTAVVGPSTPLSPLLFSRGADELSGFLITDPDGLFEAVLAPDDPEGPRHTLFQCGRFVRLLRAGRAGSA